MQPGATPAGAMLVTGGAVRVGRAIALEFARRGRSVAVTYRTSGNEAVAVAEEIRGLGAGAAAILCDQRDPGSIESAVRAAEERVGPVAVLVNNASVFRRTPLEEATLEDWDEHLEVNLRGPWLFSRLLGPRMRERGGGVILNLLDVASARPYPAYLPYSVSKAGLTALTLGLARALAPEVRVNGVAPGVALWPEGFPEDQQRALLARTPLGRAGTPADIARAVAFLAEDAPFVTGAVLPVDGGLGLV